jgi:hypothetical protein
MLFEVMLFEVMLFEVTAISLYRVLSGVSPEPAPL